TSAAFDSAAVGDGKTVTVSGITLSGSKAGNYTLSSNSATAKASITKAPITVTASAAGKVYDGSPNASVTLSCTGIINNEDVSTSYTSAAFDSAAVGDGKTVTVSGITLTGAKAGNYTLSTNSATTKASITKALVTVTASASDKVYDGNTNATATLSCTGIINNEDVSTSYTSAAFDSPDAGDGKTVTVSGITLTGAKAGNYTLSSNSATAKASITKAPVTITATAVSKVYDGNPNTTATLSCTGIINNEDVSTSYTSAAFDSAAVGDGKTVTVSGISLTGSKAGNYTLSSNSATAKASITKAQSASTLTVGTVSGCGDSRSVTLTANVSGVSGGEIPSGTVTFKSGETALGSAALQNGSASFVWNGVTAGNFSITAEYNGSGNYNASSSSSGSLAVEKQAQSPLSITPPASLTYGGSAFDLAVVGGSGTGAATYSVTGTAVSVSADGKVTILSAGTAKITVTKAEDANYLPASCEITLTVNKAAPSITKLPHANPIPTGTKLSEAKLLDGAAAGVDGAPLSGVFSWEQPDFKPQNAADYDESVIFTPTDLNYAPVKVGVISIRAQSGSVTGDPFSDTDDTTGNEVKPVNQVSDAVTGTAITSIAYTPSPSFDTDMLVAGVINSDGTVEYLPKSVYKDGSVILNDKVSGKVAVFYRSIRFVDTAGKWCDEAATYMAARDVVNGVGNAQFAPDSNIKRADFVLMLVRAFAGDTAGNGTFSDVDQSAYYAKAVSVAKALGIATGADGLFSPDANITRQDMFVLFERTLEAFGLIDKNADTSLISFSDMDSAADYAKEDIILLAANGYINGTDGKINPNGTATRAEAAQMLMNFLKASAK
ncbi:MAG: YDG domain-containing protein, partial [Bacillota bacterium]|nr:YDG domain-containing protein [Bacillota bacterium]